MKIVCIGRNYAEHAAELGNAIEAEPLLFIKPETALIRDVYTYSIPTFTNDLHFELELVFTVNEACKNITEAEAWQCLDKVGLGIDFTARDIQDKLKTKGLPWEKSKAFDNSAFVATSFFGLDDLDYPKQPIQFRLLVDGAARQNGTTELMLFSPAQMIAHASTYFTIQPGDLLFTGTPAGVGKVEPGMVLDGELAGKSLFSLRIA